MMRQLCSSPMATRRLFVCLIFSLIFTTSLTNLISDGNPQSSEFSGSSLKDELDLLKSRISTLESSIGWTNQALEKRDSRITQLESIIQEKSEELASLKDQIPLFQDNRSVAAEGKTGMDQTSSAELESQVENLREEIEKQNRKKMALKARSEIAEDKIHQLNMKLKKLQKVNDLQRKMIHKIEQDLQTAEEELVNTKMEAASISDELQKINPSWLSHSVAVHIHHFQDFIATTWSAYGRPLLNLAAEMASKLQGESMRLAMPYIREIKKDFVEPCTHLIMTKGTELYYMSKTSIVPRLFKLQTMADPYIQEIERLCEPYTDQILLWFRPHLDKAQVILEPWSKIAAWAYRKVKKSVIAYHWQLQAVIWEKLQSSELTVTDLQLAGDVAWFGAAAFIALPVAFLFSKVLRGVFRKKPIERVHRHRHRHLHRRRPKF